MRFSAFTMPTPWRIKHDKRTWFVRKEFVEGCVGKMNNFTWFIGPGGFLRFRGRRSCWIFQEFYNFLDINFNSYQAKNQSIDNIKIFKRFVTDQGIVVNPLQYLKTEKSVKLNFFYQWIDSKSLINSYFPTQ